MKNLKIPEAVHNELKVFAALKKEKMGELGGFAIMLFMKERGHKFSKPKNQKS